MQKAFDIPGTGTFSRLYFTNTDTVYIYNQKFSAAGDNHTRLADLAPPFVSSVMFIVMSESELPAIKLYQVLL